MEIVVSEEKARVPVTVFRVKGQLTAETEGQLVQQAQDAYSAGMRDLLLDLGKVSFLSSAGLRAIHQIFLLLRENSSGANDEVVRAGIRKGTYHSPHLKLLNPSSDVSNVLKTAGFDMFLDIYANRRKALASF
jgi:anti-anti-sigma factor